MLPMQKQYAALVWISRPLTEDDLKNISSIKELVRFYFHIPETGYLLSMVDGPLS